MSDFDQDDELWQLMGKARSPEPSPWLAGKILREARRIEAMPPQPAWKQWLLAFAHWKAPVIAGALAIAVFCSLPSFQPAAPRQTGWSESEIPAEQLFAAFEQIDANSETEFEDEVQWLAASE